MCCFTCHRLLFHPAQLQTALAQISALDHGLDYLVDELHAVANELVEATDNSVNSDFVSYLVNKLKQHIQYTLEKRGPVGEKGDNQVRNIIDRKQKLVKSLLQGQLVKILKVCPHCVVKKYNMSLMNNAMMLMTLPKNANSSKDEPDEKAEDEEEVLVLKNKVEELDISIGGKSYLSPLIARDHLRKLYKNEKDTLIHFLKILDIDTSSDENPMDAFFMDVVTVIPPRFRPLHFMNGRQYENEATSVLRQIMVAGENLKTLIREMKGEDNNEENNKEKKEGKIEDIPGKEVKGKGKSRATKAKETKVAKKKDKEVKDKDKDQRKLHGAWNRLQILCNRIYDSEMDKLPEKKYPGVRQVLEKKEGLFRKNMMGKRVNYAARSVISPDPYISVDEIGIPEVFATKLSYPQPVTPWNVDMLKKAVLNGPNVYPGAMSITFDDGATIRLKANDKEQRARLSNFLGQHRPGTRTVNRHLVSGDVLLVNRQPTLHKPSIMAHRARVLQGEKTLRLHYANCKCYNADFDGDEMNAHFPQNELARAEAYNIVSVNKQYLVPKDGSPLGGLIQDHIVAATLLTLRGNFFTREDYQELVYYALSDLDKQIKLLPPSIWRPKCLWSGKQVVSTLIINLVPEGKEPPTSYIPAKVNSKTLFTNQLINWTTNEFFTPLKPLEMCDSSVIIRKGELHTGLIDKANIGPTPYGLIHCCYELYGGEVSNSLLSGFSRLCTIYLQIHGGITLGIEDILVNSHADSVRRTMIRKSQTVGDEVVAQAVNLGSSYTKSQLIEKLREWHTSQDPGLMKALDNCMKGKTDEINNGITKACLPDGLVKKFPNNNLQLMIQSGAKGGTVNALQISCLLGQIELEGRRVPLMMSGRTLPSFLPYDTSPKAGGFVTGRFLTGIRPQEFFFHCMAGREGLIDTAVKTSRSGYLQRCLVKHLEGLCVQYDSTVRDADGSLIQIQYGEDGVDICRNQLLRPKAMSLLVHNRGVLLPDKKEQEMLQRCPDKSKILKMKKLIKDWEKMNGTDRLVRRQGSGFQEYFDVKVKEYQDSDTEKALEPEAVREIIDSWFYLPKSSKRQLNFYFLPCPGPLSCMFRSCSNYGVITEKLENQIKDYVENDRNCLVQVEENDFGSEEWKGRRVISLEDFKKIVFSRFLKSLCEPGEAVGLLAAQSIGEPSTQMTLNTFHFAGRGDMNVTLGIPRLREILMTASPKISTPNMDLPFLPNLGASAARKAERVRRKLNSVKLSDVLESISVEEKLKITEADCARFYLIKFKFLPYSTYRKKFYAKPDTILHFIESKFIKTLLVAISRAELIQKKYNSLYDHSTHTRTSNAGNSSTDDSENDVPPPPKADNYDAMSSDDEDNAVEEDTHAAQTKARRNQDLDYEEPEEEEIEANQEPDEDADKLIILDESDEHKPKTDEEEENLDAQNESNQMSVDEINELAAIKAARKDSVIKLDPSIDHYDFDPRKGEWARVTLKYPLKNDLVDIATIVVEEAKKAYVYKVGSIERAVLVDDRRAKESGSDYGKMIKTEGVSFLSMVNYNRIFDLNKMYSNDIHAIANFYGIEAARTAITKEIANVFSVYGIEVDPRHLSLIADYMTFDGSIKGMNRVSMAGSSSPLQQMTFETTAAFLKSALLLGEY